jgi:hypothetical protein
MELINTKTVLVWLKSKSQDNIEVEKLQNTLCKVISPVPIFDTQFDCLNYLCTTVLAAVVFLIISADYEDLIVTGFQKFNNIQAIYRYGQIASQNEAIIDNYDDLCFHLISDLATHYNKLGSTCSAKQDAKTAKNMFMKAHELYNILVEL